MSKSVRATSLATAGLEPVHPAMLLRFVDAFPSAAGAVKRPRKVRSPRDPGPNVDAPKRSATGGRPANSDVLVLHL